MARFDELLTIQGRLWKKVEDLGRGDGRIEDYHDVWRQIRNEIAREHPGSYGTDEMRAEATVDRRRNVIYGTPVASLQGRKP